MKSLRNLFEKIEQGSSKQLDKFLKEALYKYDTGINKLVFKPGQSLTEFLDWNLIKGVLKLDVFTSIEKHISKHFKHPKLKQLLEFPVLFLGLLPKNTPALYSLMNYADIKLGTWYPDGGIYSVVNGMYELAKELGVKFYFDHEVTQINFSKNKATGVTVKNNNSHKEFEADAVIGSADYHFIETELLPRAFKKLF